MKNKMIWFKEIAVRQGDGWEMKKNYGFKFDDLLVGEAWEECPTLFHVKFLYKGDVTTEVLLNAKQIEGTEKALFQA